MFLPVAGPVVGRGAVEGLHGGQQSVAWRHWRGQPDVFGVQGLVVVVFQLDQEKENVVSLAVACQCLVMHTSLIINSPIVDLPHSTWV